LTSVAALALDPDLPLEHLTGDRVDSKEEWIDKVITALPVGEEAA
jgi:hypothetical protein